MTSCTTWAVKFGNFFWQSTFHPGPAWSKNSILPNLLLFILMVNRWPPLEFQGIPSYRNNSSAGISCKSPNGIMEKFINFRPFSESLESVLHQIKQKCLESTVTQVYQKSRPQLMPFFSFFLAQNTARSYKTLVLPESFVWVMWGSHAARSIFRICARRYWLASLLYRFWMVDGSGLNYILAPWILHFSRQNTPQCPIKLL